MSETSETELPGQATPHACANCGSSLAGHFCSICGQPNTQVRRPFYSLLRDLLNVLLDLDGRAYRSVFFLFTRPAFLSNAYLDGQRFRYTPPLRLFLAISIIFFVVLTTQNALENLSAALNEAQATQAGEAPATSNDDEPFIQGEFDEEDLEGIYELIEQINLPFLSAQANDNLHAVMREQARENYEDLVSDPAGTLSNLLEYITVFMLTMMPLMALIQKVLFFPSGRLYIEHIVLTLHNTAFVILVFLLSTLLEVVVARDVFLLSGTADVLDSLIMLWAPIYLLLSLKFFFGWGWFISIFLFLLMSLIYAICMATGLALLGMTLFLLF